MMTSVRRLQIAFCRRTPWKRESRASLPANACSRPTSAVRAGAPVTAAYMVQRTFISSPQASIAGGVATAAKLLLLSTPSKKQARLGAYPSERPERMRGQYRDRQFETLRSLLRKSISV
jgi:hypothetical protein